MTLNCASSDDALRALLSRYPEARDIEVRGAGLEEAFFALTGGRRLTFADQVQEVR